jgi:hypothetical protein
VAFSICFSPLECSSASRFLQSPGQCACVYRHCFSASELARGIARPHTRLLRQVFNRSLTSSADATPFGICRHLWGGNARWLEAVGVEVWPIVLDKCAHSYTDKAFNDKQKCPAGLTDFKLQWASYAIALMWIEQRMAHVPHTCFASWFIISSDRVVACGFSRTACRDCSAYAFCHCVDTFLLNTHAYCGRPHCRAQTPNVPVGCCLPTFTRTSKPIRSSR